MTAIKDRFETNEIFEAVLDKASEEEICALFEEVKLAYSRLIPLRDKIQTARDEAKANLDEAEANLDEAKANLDEAKANAAMSVEAYHVYHHVYYSFYAISTELETYLCEVNRAVRMVSVLRDKLRRVCIRLDQKVKS